MKRENEGKGLRSRIRSGEVTRRDLNRRLGELAFASVNDCVRLALDKDPDLKKLDLSLLSELRRTEKGAVEIKLIDRLQVLKLLERTAKEEGCDVMELLQALQENAE